MSASMQAKLLRVLEDGEVRPVGGQNARRVNVRVVAATHRDLSLLVTARAFREDLYYRLAAIVIRIPPLRERLEDLPAVAVALLRRDPMTKDFRIEVPALAALTEHTWPGNVRELSNVLRAAAAMTEEANVIERPALEAAISARSRTPNAPAALLETTLAALRARHKSELGELVARCAYRSEREQAPRCACARREPPRSVPCARVNDAPATGSHSHYKNRVRSLLLIHGPRTLHEGLRGVWTMKKTLGAGTLLLAAGCIFVGACASDNESETPPTVLGMTNTIAPAVDDGEVQIYIVQTPVSLPVRKPTDTEKQTLGKQDPFPRSPFFLASDARVTVKFTLTNLDSDNSHVVEVLMDPWNEFVRYTPGQQVVDEQTTPNLSGIDRYFILQPLQRIEGIFSPDDMNEMAIDLSTVEAIAKSPPDPKGDFAGPVLYNRAFNVQNRSNVEDPLISKYIPPVIAGLTGFDLGLRTNERAQIAIEISLDVTDLNGNRILAPDDTTDKPIGPPGTRLTPPAAPADDE